MPPEYGIDERAQVAVEDVPLGEHGALETVTDAGDLQAVGATAVAAAYGTVAATGQWRDIRRRFVRNKLAVLGLIMVVLLIIVAIFAPLLAPYDPYQITTDTLLNTLASPSPKHWFGTDADGIDQFSKVLYGTRIALEVGLASIALSVVIGVFLGALAGYFGRAWDATIMRVADIFFAFPLLIGAIVIITVRGTGVTSVILALGIFGWAPIARLLRGSILSVREAEYVEGARSLGASRWRIVTRHVLPNSYAPVLIYATFSVGVAIVAEASLSFLGAGVKPGVPEWGSMIADGQPYFRDMPWLSLLPSIPVVLTVLAFVFVGDGLRDALDPRAKVRISH